MAEFYKKLYIQFYQFLYIVNLLITQIYIILIYCANFIFLLFLGGYSGDMHPVIPAMCTHLLNCYFDKSRICKVADYKRRR
jgi:hypothetical protein